MMLTRIFHPLALLSVALGMTCASASTQAASYELNAEQTARIQQYLPRTYAKLAKRDPVHAICIGDSVMINWSYGPDNGNVLKAWNGVFLQELADQFIYNGGVRLVRPAKGQPAKLTNFIGPEITVQNFSRGGRQIFHALQPLNTTAFENNPDLVIVSYGINDANNGQPLDVYRRNVQQVVDTVKAHNADLILCGPSLILENPPELKLALTRPYTDTMREVAQANGVFFADLGDLTWLIQLEQRVHPLDEVKKKLAKQAAKAEAAAATAAEAAKNDPKAPAPPAPPRAPVLENPLEDEMNADPDKKAMVSFQQIVDLLKTRYNHGDIADLVHPDTPSQQLLGRRVFQELINGPKKVPWVMGGASVNLENSETCKLTYRLENPTDQEQTYAVLPLLTPTWTPQDAPSQVALKPGKKTLVNVTYKRTPPATTQGRSDLFPPHEAVFRLPILTAGGGMARIEEARAGITPIAVLWNTGAAFNQQTIELSGRFANTSGQTVVGKWEATWMGQTATGTFSATGTSEEPFRVRFNAPPTTRQKGTVTFQVTLGNNSYRFDRELEVVRNISLKEPVPLLSPNTYLRDQPQNPLMPDTTSPGVVLRADADSNALYLTYDIYGYRLQDSPAGTGAVGLELNLDARSYGKRLTPGSTDAIRMVATAADGDATVSPMPAWIFGNGYAMYYDEKQVKCRLSSRPDGARRVTVTLPRGYLYLHEWAMGNANSQLGINTTLQIWQNGESGQGAYQTFCLTMSGRHRDDAESLAVLELSDKPTGRWTVRLY